MTWRGLPALFAAMQTFFLLAANAANAFICMTPDWHGVLAQFLIELAAAPMDEGFPY